MLFPWQAMERACFWFLCVSAILKLDILQEIFMNTVLSLIPIESRSHNLWNSTDKVSFTVPCTSCSWISRTCVTRFVPAVDLNTKPKLLNTLTYLFRKADYSRVLHSWRRPKNSANQLQIHRTFSVRVWAASLVQFGCTWSVVFQALDLLLAAD